MEPHINEERYMIKHCVPLVKPYYQNHTPTSTTLHERLGRVKVQQRAERLHNSKISKNVRIGKKHEKGVDNTKLK